MSVHWLAEKLTTRVTCVMHPVDGRKTPCIHWPKLAVDDAVADPLAENVWRIYAAPKCDEVWYSGSKLTDADVKRVAGVGGGG